MYHVCNYVLTLFCTQKWQSKVETTGIFGCKMFGAINHGAVNQPFIVVYKKRGILSEGDCTSQLVN